MIGNYSFDNFYTNKNNTQAFFAARYVAEHPGQTGNPLYILKKAYSYGKHFYDEVNMDPVAYFWGIFSEFIPDEEVEKVLAEISKEE